MQLLINRSIYGLKVEAMGRNLSVINISITVMSNEKLRLQHWMATEVF